GDRAGLVRLQVRPAGRPRSGARRALHPQSVFRGGAASADRTGPTRERVRDGAAGGAALYRRAWATVGISAAALSAGGQELPDDRPRLHRRTPSVTGARAPIAGAAGAGRFRGYRS